MRNMVMNNLAALVPDLTKYNLMDRCFLYSFDEINDEKFFAAFDILSEIKSKYPQIRTLTTANDRDFGRTNGLDKVIDCWCPQVERFVEQQDLVREVQKSGKKVWYYSCLWDPGMDMLVEKPLTSVRLLAGLNQIRLGADGFLYYAVSSGQYSHAPIDSLTPLTNHDGNNSGYNGDGLLLYTTTYGPQPAIRLKALRDGFEDIEYAHLLEKIPFSKMTKEDRALRDELLTIPEALISHLEVYDQTGEALTKWRNQAGQMLERYAAILPPEPAPKAPLTIPDTPDYAKSAPGAVFTPHYVGEKLPETIPAPAQVPVQTPAPAKAPAAAPVAQKAPQSDEKIVITISSRPQPMFKKGETVQFEIAGKLGNDFISGGKMTIEFSNSGNQILQETPVDFAQSNPVRIPFTMKDPGLVFVRAKLLTGLPQNVPVASIALHVAAFSPEEIQPARPEPPDFIEFWNAGVERTKNLPVELTPFPGKQYPDHTPYLLTVSMPDNEKFYAVVLRPKKPGKYRIMVAIPGAGPGTGDIWTNDESAQNIILWMHVHKYPPSVDRKEMEKLYAEYMKKIGMPYQHENALDRERYFYRRVFLGMNRALDYVCTLPEWDQKNVQVTGSSQGGAGTIALAALNPHVTAIGLNVPAMCDHNAFAAGRMPGWPWQQLRTENPPSLDAVAPYYDTANFARHVKVPAFVAVGFCDRTAPAASGYAAFNQLSGEKVMLPMFTRAHEIPPEYGKGLNEFLKKHLIP